jgi:hypothetical protein
VGIFAKGVMISGKPAELEAVDIIDDIAEPVFSISDSPAVRHCRSSRESVGQDPLVLDQYEARTVQVGYLYNIFGTIHSFFRSGPARWREVGKDFMQREISRKGRLLHFIME